MNKIVFGLLVFVAFTCIHCFDDIDNLKQWQGTFNNGKRGSLGGNLFICVDYEKRQAYGTYGNGGLVYGGFNADGSEFSGNWFEAGYDRPHGPFSLSLSGGGFTGTWSYFVDDDDNNALFTTSTAWSGSRSSNARPTNQECLYPSQGVDLFKDYENVEYTGFSAAGVYQDEQQICYDKGTTYQKTQYPTVSAVLTGAGTTIGYTPDQGVSLLMSDFIYVDDDDQGTSRYRPENNARVMGTGVFYEGGADLGIDDDDTIPTTRIVVGRKISNTMTVLNVWRGFYNELSSSRTLVKTGLKAPALATCVASFIPPRTGYGVNDVISDFVFDLVQQAIDGMYDSIVNRPNRIGDFEVNVNVIQNDDRGECDDACDDDNDDNCSNRDSVCNCNDIEDDGDDDECGYLRDGYLNPSIAKNNNNNIQYNDLSNSSAIAIVPTLLFAVLAFFLF